MTYRLAWIASSILLTLASCSGHGANPSTGGAGGAETPSAGGAGGAGGEGETTSGTSASTTSTTSSTHAATTTSTTSTSHAASSSRAASSAGVGGGSDCAVDGLPGTCMDVASCAAIESHASTPGHCPGAADIQCCTPYGLAVCDPDAMPRPEPNAGLTVEAPGTGGCPDGMVRVTTFCIDVYEASLVRADDGSPWSPFYNPGTTPVRAVSVEGAVPQGYIDGVQAGEACTNAGKRLCTDAEWLRACEGPEGFTYPYGDTKELGVCNDHRDTHPAVEYFGTTSSTVYSMIDNACINQLPETVDRTGSRTGCVTAEGAFDMMGNVHEWTADPAGTFRGGYYVDTVLNGPGCHYATTAHNTSHWDYSTGFRCCAD